VLEKSDFGIDMFHPSRCLVPIIISAALALTGCHRRPRDGAAAPPVLAPIIVRVDAPAPVYSPIPSSLPPYVSPPDPAEVERERGDRAFTAGSYDEAIQAYQKLLHISPGGGGHDETLFRLGLCYALRNGGEPDWQRAKTFLKQLVSDYPRSLLKPPAVLIVTLRSQAEELSGDVKAREQAMRQLSVELERLKQIDADRGHR
jgi:tetratricopeptide (TPR) repeat protein